MLNPLQRSAVSMSTLFDDPLISMIEGRRA